MTQKVALITGVTGQDGSFLSELLLSKDYSVWGIVRRSSCNNTERLSGIMNNNNFHLIEGDITDPTGIYNIIKSVKPNEIYNLAAQSHVHTSFDQPLTSVDITGKGIVSILEAVRFLNKDIRVYQAGSSEMFGDTKTVPQNENTVFSPVSPYAISKVMAHNFVTLYRKAYGLFACNGILFNHESERRGINFVTRKITRYVGTIDAYMHHVKYIPSPEQIGYLELGNLDANRDWGYAPDFVEGMWMMLQHDKPDDFVLATGQTRTIKDLLDTAFCLLGISDWTKFVKVSDQYKRPSDVPVLMGDPSKAKNVLGWKPSTDFKSMISKMVKHDSWLARRTMV